MFSVSCAPVFHAWVAVVALAVGSVDATMRVCNRLFCSFSVFAHVFVLSLVCSEFFYYFLLFSLFWRLSLSFIC